MRIRPEAADDWDAVDQVNDAAFGGGDPAALVRRLRHDGEIAEHASARRTGSRLSCEPRAVLF
jgi:predicted N-acetyltransferase YhbS